MKNAIKWENIALDYIRRNVSLDRIGEVERALAVWSSMDVEKYLDEIFMESVYRGHKGSYKIMYSKFRGEMYLGFILYILFVEPKIDIDCYDSSREVKKIKRVLKKRFEKDSYFLRYCQEFLKIKTGDENEKTGWINTEPYIYPILGGEIFFYCTLKALIDISKKALTDKKYDYLPWMNWKEGVVEYLIHEAIGPDNVFKKYVLMAKNKRRKSQCT
ncbi:MAG: hypothetical protein ACPLRY_06160 [Candidatus Bathyarchaeales archaeon]